MADDADMAQVRMEQEEEFRRRAPRPPSLPYCGLCYYCGNDVPDPKKYCDGDCASDHAFELRMKERNGRG